MGIGVSWLNWSSKLFFWLLILFVWYSGNLIQFDDQYMPYRRINNKVYNEVSLIGNLSHYTIKHF